MAEAYLNYLFEKLPDDLETLESITEYSLNKEFPHLHLAAVQCLRHLQEGDCSGIANIKQLLMKIWGTKSMKFVNWMRLHNPDEEYYWRQSDLSKKKDKIPSLLYISCLLGFTDIR